LELLDGDFEFAIHVVLLLLCFALLIVQFLLLLLNSFQAALDVLQTALGVAQTHCIHIVVSHRFLQSGLLDALSRERALELKHAGLEASDNELTVLDLQLDVLVFVLKLLDDVKVLFSDVVVVLLHFTEGGFMIDQRSLMC
jgi:hypothetical protein